jgi:hypothetical protein
VVDGSWKKNDKSPACIICNYPLLVENVEDPENRWKTLQFTNLARRYDIQIQGSQKILTPLASL